MAYQIVAILMISTEFDGHASIASL